MNHFRSLESFVSFLLQVNEDKVKFSAPCWIRQHLYSLSSVQPSRRILSDIIRYYQNQPKYLVSLLPCTVPLRTRNIIWNYFSLSDPQLTFPSSLFLNYWFNSWLRYEFLKFFASYTSPGSITGPISFKLPDPCTFFLLSTI